MNDNTQFDDTPYSYTATADNTRPPDAVRYYGDGVITTVGAPGEDKKGDDWQYFTLGITPYGVPDAVEIYDSMAINMRRFAPDADNSDLDDRGRMRVNIAKKRWNHLLGVTGVSISRPSDFKTMLHKVVYVRTSLDNRDNTKLRFDDFEAPRTAQGGVAA